MLVTWQFFFQKKSPRKQFKWTKHFWFKKDSRSILLATKTFAFATMFELTSPLFPNSTSQAFHFVIWWLKSIAPHTICLLNNFVHMIRSNKFPDFFTHPSPNKVALENKNKGMGGESRKQECKKWHKNVHLNNVKIGRIWIVWWMPIFNTFHFRFTTEPEKAAHPEKGSTHLFLFNPIIIFRIFDTEFSSPIQAAQCVSWMELFRLLCCLPFCRKIHQRKATFPSPSFKLRSISNWQQTLMLRVLESMLIVGGGGELKDIYKL